MTSVSSIAVSRDSASLTVEVPLAFRKQGGRKQVISPPGAPNWAPAPYQIQTTLVKAIARAHRWRALLENGTYASAAELSAAERINPSYVARVLRPAHTEPRHSVKAISDRVAETTTARFRAVRVVPHPRFGSRT